MTNLHLPVTLTLYAVLASQSNLPAHVCSPVVVPDVRILNGQNYTDPGEGN